MASDGLAVSLWETMRKPGEAVFEVGRARAERASSIVSGTWLPSRVSACAAVVHGAFVDPMDATDALFATDNYKAGVLIGEYAKAAYAAQSGGKPVKMVLTRPDEFDVIATLNLNGDYISDALAAQVGGIGIAPGANINYVSGHAIFEATHGTAPKYADQDKVNPGSVILSGEMMFRYMGWNEAADLIEKGIEASIRQKVVTYDLARQMEGATEVRTSAFADKIIENMG